MEKYRIYKGIRINFYEIKWEKTSYIGDKKTISKILRALSTSHNFVFEMRKEIEG